MPLTFATLLVLIAFGVFALQFFARARQLNVATGNQGPLPVAERYQPMLRLLSAEDAEVIGADKALAKKFRARRIQIFREYLRCLTKDYGRLLAGVRLAMVSSGTDRPDLAKALLLNKVGFVLALCRIELSLTLFQAGIGKVDVSRLVEALDILRTQVSFPMQARIPA